MANVGWDRINPRITILALPNAKGFLWRADERVEVRATSCPYDGKLSLKVDEPGIGKRHEDMERKREYYHITIFL